MVPVCKDQGIPGISIINFGLVKHIMIHLTNTGLSILTLMVPTGYLLMAPVNHHHTLLWTEEAYCHSLLWRLSATVCCGGLHTDLYINICTSIISDITSRIEISHQM